MLAVVGVVVLVVAVIALRDPKNPGSPSAAASSSRVTSHSSSAPASRPRSSSTAAPSTSAPTSSSPPLTAAQLKNDFPLVVLNSTATQGLAAEAAQHFEQGGWKVTSYGNLTNSILSTCAYFDPSVSHAKAAAQELQREYPTIQRVEPKFAGLADGPIVVVLTTDYSNG